MVLLHGSTLVISYSFCLDIFLGHLMLIAYLNIRLWKESILFAVFDVTVHSSELYRKMDAANMLKVLTLVSMLICLDLYV